MDCPQCSTPNVIEIEHILGEGIEVRFYACTNCEQRWWDREGVEIDIAEVLEIVRKNPT